MKHFFVFVCEICGKESRESEEIKHCEAAHFGLTIDEKFKWDGLKAIVERAAQIVSLTKNIKTEVQFDNAIQDLMSFETEHNLLKDA